MALTLFQGVPNASAQSTFGSSIIGTVQDTAGAAVPGVTLTVINLTDNSLRNTTTDASGAYVALNLIPGSYEIAARKYGFKTAKAKISLDARRQLRTDLKLELATVGENAQGDNISAAAIAKELDGMKGRFEELEKLLKVKLAEEQATAANSAPATLLATTGKDPSEIPPLPNTLAKPREPMTVAGNIPVRGAPAAAPSPEPSQAAAQTPETTPAASTVDKVTPFADYDWTWLNGISRPA